jgi:hypothetical protein
VVITAGYAGNFELVIRKEIGPYSLDEDFNFEAN